MKYNEKELSIVKGVLIGYIVNLLDTCDYKLLSEKQMTRTNKIRDLGCYCVAKHSISINKKCRGKRPTLVHEMLELLMAKLYSAEFIEKITDKPEDIPHFLISHDILDKMAVKILKWKKLR